jgi:hypothetical protein
MTIKSLFPQRAKDLTMRFARVVFLVAGIYGVLILTPIYFMEGKIGRETPPAVTHPEYFFAGFWEAR